MNTTSRNHNILILTFRLFILRNPYSASIAEKLDMVYTKFGDRNFTLQVVARECPNIFAQNIVNIYIKLPEI